MVLCKEKEMTTAMVMLLGTIPLGTQGLCDFAKSLSLEFSSLSYSEAEVSNKEGSIA